MKVIVHEINSKIVLKFFKTCTLPDCVKTISAIDFNVAFTFFKSNKFH